MKPNIHVRDKVIYSKLQPTPGEQAAHVTYKGNGNISKPEMVNQAIEDRERRKLIPRGEGNICVSIQPGDELGQLSFNVQFEGTYGDYGFCLKEHNELLLHVSEWVKELLSELQIDFNVTVEGKPCPYTEQRLEVDLAARIMEGHVTLGQAHQIMEGHVTLEQAREEHGHRSQHTRQS